MSAPLPRDTEINVLEVALRVVSTPDQPVQVSMAEAYAFCLYVLKKNDMPMPAETPVFGGNDLPSSLAAPLASAVAAHDVLEDARAAIMTGRDSWVLTHRTRRQLVAAIDDFNTAFNTLKTRFNQEFPTDGNR
jgi:hypothetical protein